MSISIYYQFKSEKDLSAAGFLKSIQDFWDKEFDGEPYESWSWYDPEYDNGSYKYEGATSFIMDEELILDSIMAAINLLTQIRREIGGSDWSVNLDDTDIEWHEEDQSYHLG